MGNTLEKELKISIGDIFTDDENYPKRAEWCNTNGCRIVELTPDKEGRRFEIVAVPQKDLDEAKAEKIDEIIKSKNNQLNNGGLEYDNDLFSYDDKALLRISGTILDWQEQISRSMVQTENIVQPWISKSNNVHPLSYDKLIELARLLRQEVQKIVFYGTYLEKLAKAATSLDEIDAIVWDYKTASDTGVIDRLIAENTLINS